MACQVIAGKISSVCSHCDEALQLYGGKPDDLTGKHSLWFLRLEKHCSRVVFGFYYSWVGDNKEFLIGGALVQINENLKSLRRSMMGGGAFPV